MKRVGWGPTNHKTPPSGRRVAGLTPRWIAYDVLLQVERDGAFADALLGRALAEDTELRTEDRRLVTRLVYGTLAWQGLLDWRLAKWTRGGALPVPELLVAIRLGLFQIQILERIPDHAAVDTSVELARNAKGQQKSGFVNAILRRALREGPRTPTGNKRRDVAIRLSHPQWLVERWIAERGEEATLRLLAANNEGAPLVVRSAAPGVSREIVAGQLEAEGVLTTPTEFSPDGLEVTKGHGAAAERSGRIAPEGPAIVAQAEASQLIAYAVAARPGEQILDACCAPGGKSLQLAATGARVIAADLRPRGFRRIRELGQHLGFEALHLAQGDARKPPFAPESFDAVLVDAPCSGTGTLRQHPEIRWRLEANQVTKLAELQNEILDGVRPLVRRGGRLLYSTCSLLEEENELVVRAFLERHPEFRRADLTPNLPEPARRFVREGALHTSPDDHGQDGFYAACLVRYE